MNDQPKQQPEQKPEPSARKKQIDARKARVAELHADPEGRQSRVRVNPSNDAIRKGIAHPSGNIKFPESGSVEWPNDSFTKRRIREGSVTREETAKAKEQPKAPPPPPKPAA